MWIFCKHGFFSVVEHRDDRRFLHVRARFRGDLERFFAARGILTEITETPDADYRFRATVWREWWESAIVAETRDIDYVNFKAAAEGTPEWHNTLFDVWTALRAGQARQVREESWPGGSLA